MTKTFRKDLRLIEAVQAHPVLYNKRSADYKDSVVKNKAWTEVAATSCMPVAAVQYRWKALRERFLREKRRTEAGEMTVEGVTVWPLTTALQFLNGHLNPRRTVSSYDRGSATWSPLETDWTEPVHHPLTCESPPSRPTLEDSLRALISSFEKHLKQRQQHLQHLQRQNQLQQQKQQQAVRLVEPGDIALQFANLCRLMILYALQDKSESEMKETMTKIVMFINSL